MRLKDITPQWLIKNHFFGIYREDSDGNFFIPDPQNPSNAMPESILQQAIEESISFLETYLDVAIRFQENIVEYHDYDKDLYNDFIQVNLRSYPVRRVDSLEIVYGEGGPVIWNVPSEMIQIHGPRSKFGLLNVLPSWGVSTQYDPALQWIIPSALNTSHAPSIIKVTYDAGMDGLEDANSNPLHLDAAVVRAISLKSAIHPFNLLGDIVLGAGIASISSSVDGLSQSINTTSSAENAAYSARIIMHRNELFGERGVPGLLEILQKEWRRQALAVL